MSAATKKAPAKSAARRAEKKSLDGIEVRKKIKNGKVVGKTYRVGDFGTQAPKSHRGI